MKRALVAGAFSVGFLVGTAATCAAQEHATWTSRVAVGAVLTGGDDVPVLDREPSTRLALGNGASVLFDLSRDLSASVQFTIGFGWMNLPARQLTAQTANRLDGFTPTAYHLGVTYMLRTPSRVDLYVGPMLVSTGRDLAGAASDVAVKPIALSSAVGPGLQAGVRLKLCGCDALAIDVGMRWSRLRAPISGDGRYDVNPWQIVAGVAVRH